MKKVIAILILALGFVFTANAQEKKRKNLTTDEKVAKRVEKLTTDLALSDAQVQQITPLINEGVLEREAMKAKRKAMKEQGKEPTEEERAAFKAKREERKLYYKGEMEKILTPEQIEKLEKMKAERKGKKKRRWSKDK